MVESEQSVSTVESWVTSLIHSRIKLVQQKTRDPGLVFS